MSKANRGSNHVPLRLGAAVAIVAVVHISVIVFVFLKTVRSWKRFGERP